MHPNRLTNVVAKDGMRFSTDYLESVRNGKTLSVRIYNKTTSAFDDITIHVVDREGVPRSLVPIQALTSRGYNFGEHLKYRLFNEKIEVRPNTLTLQQEFEQAELDDEGIAIPPAWLMQAFIANTSARKYTASAKAMVNFIATKYAKHFGDFDKVQNVLDFGCGSGRVLERMPRKEGRQYFGIDLHKDGVDWLRLSYPESQTFVGAGEPPLPPDIHSIDLLYAISVLNHLDQRLEAAWLQEWRRVTRPGAALFVTFRGEDYLELHTDPQFRQEISRALSENDGFYFQSNEAWKGILPAFYAASFHTVKYVEKTWGQYFEIVELISSKESIVRQNMAILRRT